jgi:hypothetical protein
MTLDMHKYIGILVAGFITLLIGCTDNGSGTEDRGDHVWKTQTDALEKAREVEQILHSAAQKRRERMEQSQ